MEQQIEVKTKHREKLNAEMQALYIQIFNAALELLDKGKPEKGSFGRMQTKVSHGGFEISSGADLKKASGITFWHGKNDISRINTDFLNKKRFSGTHWDGAFLLPLSRNSANEILASLQNPRGGVTNPIPQPK